MFCNNCGNSLSEGMLFCTKCGAKLDSTQPQQPNPTTQEPQPMAQAQWPMTQEPQPVAQAQRPEPHQLPAQYPQPQYTQPQYPRPQYPQYPQYPQSQQPQQPQPPGYPAQYPHQNQSQPHYAQQPQAYPTAKKKSKAPLIITVSVIAAVIVIVSAILLIPIILGLNNAEYDDAIYNNGSDITIGEEDLANRELEVLSPSQIFENNKDSVFQIIADIGDGWYAYGSGFIVSRTGIAVTNHHVMEGAISATAVFNDGREYDISGYYTYDIDNDLAIIQVDGEGDSFRPAAIGNSDEVVVGDPVYAAGGPDGDPLTFTNGMVSRIAHEPIQFDIYTIEGMIQSTAAIYGGNSGGPLLNSYGQVIGINSAGHTARPSVQWAVPVNRVVLPSVGDITNPLPIGEHIQTLWDGRITYLTQFPFIPNFLSISRNATLLFGGTADDAGFELVLDIDIYGVYHFDYAFYYSLAYEYWVDDTDLFDESLMEHDFILQGMENVEDDFYAFFFHPEHNTTLAYTYHREDEILTIVIGQGNAFDAFFGDALLPSTGVPPENAALIPELFGRWICTDTDNPHLFLCELVFSDDGRFVDYDGDRGDWWVSDNLLTLHFDEDDYGSLAYSFNLVGNNILEILIDGEIAVRLHRE